MKKYVHTSVAKGTHFLDKMPEIHCWILHTAVIKALKENIKIEIGLAQNSHWDGLVTLKLLEK